MATCVLAAALAAMADGQCSAPAGFLPVYKTFKKPPFCEAPYSASVQSQSECSAAARLLGLRDKTATPAPSPMLGRGLPIGCYFWEKRAKSELEALFWNGGEQIHRTRARGREESHSSGAAVICKLESVQKAVSAMSSPGWAEGPLIDSTPQHQAAIISHIVVNNSEDLRKINTLLLDGSTKSFAEVAQDVSDCSTSEVGGQLGVVVRGQLQQELDEAVFTVQAPILWMGSILGRHNRVGQAMFSGVETTQGVHTVLVHELIAGDDASQPHTDHRPQQLDGFQGLPSGASPMGATRSLSEEQIITDTDSDVVAVSQKVEELKRRKQAAIADEDYEEAQRIKEEIRALESGSKVDGDRE